MEYRCKTITVNKLVATPGGFVMPMCQECKTADCENPIEVRRISIVGVNKDVRAFVRGTQISFVVNCMGYTK